MELWGIDLKMNWRCFRYLTCLSRFRLGLCEVWQGYRLAELQGSGEQEKIKISGEVGDDDGN
jgi:hypothetical protein